MKLSPISYILEIFVFGIHANSIYLILPTQWPNIPQLPDSQVVRIVSTIIFATGIVILFIAWFGLGTKPSLGIDKNRLNTSGLYKFSRNPQLVAYGIMLVSYTILFFSWLTIIWILLYIVASYFMVKSEEEFLEQKYRQEYKEYCNSVPRIL
jgi:protein-S-isoprenylcysteine O-methyltransferase Ste14